MNLGEIIKLRKSSRTYTDRQLDPGVKEALKRAFSISGNGLFGEKLLFEFIERTPGTREKMRFDYGYITNHHSYILGKTKNTADARMSYGYLLEKIVLQATGLGLSTCWMGYFDPEYFSEIELAGDETIPSIVITGYAEEKRPVKERMIRMAVRASYRKPWNELFFSGNMHKPLTEKEAGPYAEALEMARLAPSSGNTQPWRVLRQEGSSIFHFYKKVIKASYEERGLHDVDLGIFMAHFEGMNASRQLEGKWEKLEKPLLQVAEGLEYKLSWKGQ